MKLVSVNHNDITRTLLGLFIFTLFLFFPNCLIAQVTPSPSCTKEYTGKKKNITNGKVFCVKSNLEIVKDITIKHGGTLIVKTGVVLKVTGAIIVEGTLIIEEGAGVDLIGSFTIGTHGSQKDTKVYLAEKSFLTFTGSLVQQDPSSQGYYTDGKAQIVMSDHSLVEICGSFKQGSIDYPFIEYNGAGKDAYFVAKNTATGTNQSGNISELSDSNNIVWIAMGDVTNLSPDNAQYCGPQAKKEDCALWPTGLLQEENNCNDAPIIIDNLTSKADLEVSTLSQDGTGVVLAGDEITYTVKVKNAGPDAANGALFNFDLPPGFQTTAADISFDANDCGSQIGGLVYNPTENSFSVELNLPGGCEVTYRFPVATTTNVALGKNEFVASILRPDGVVDPDATNQNGQPPTDPFDECAQNGQGGNCNNIKRNSILYSTGCFISVTGEGFSWSYKGAKTKIEQTTIQPSTSAGFTFDIYELDNSFNMEINGVLLATEEIQFQKNGTNGRNVQFADGTKYEDDTNFIYKLLGNAANPLIRVIIDPNGNVSMYGSKVSGGILYPLELINGNSFNTVPWDLGEDPNEIKVTQKVTGLTIMRGYGYGTNAAPCTYTIQKEGVFNDANNSGYAEVGELITYTFTVDNENDVPIYKVVLNDPILGGNINVQPIGDNNNDQILNILETWTYTVNYVITQNDIDKGGIYNRASVRGEDDTSIPYDIKLSEDPTPYTLGELGYDENRPYHTFVPLKLGSFTITNPMIRQMMKNQ